MYYCGSEEIFDLSLNLVKPKYIPATHEDLIKEPLYFKGAASVLLERYKNKPDRIIAEIIHELYLYSINMQIYNCLYFLNIYSKGKFKLDLDSSDNIIFRYKDFKKWHDKLLMDIDKEKLYFDD
jgi:hypothetical protein